MICDAQDLSRFNDRSFDLVFSSNMLEHIPDVNKCLNECRRVLSDDGLMFHFMPNRWWRFINSVLTISKFKIPRTHGVSSNLVKEFYIFGAQVWKKKFEQNNLVLQDIAGMPFYVGHGNTFIPIIKIGNVLGLPASFLYIIRKK
jgi:ubiquinone/menaquinone biosynthesis C-methylase UbiE